MLGVATTWPQGGGVLPQATEFDWDGDVPLGLKMQDLVIYEMHVRGFTRDESAGCKHPGNFQQGSSSHLKYQHSVLSLFV